jgi:phosphate transport system permease protein
MLKNLTSARHPARRMRRLKEKLIEAILFLCAASSVFVTLAIVVILVSESMPFFKQVPLKQFLTDTQWTPLFSDAHFGILPLLSGTLMTTLIAVFFSIPVGTIIASLMSEYLRPGLRDWTKPALELLAAIPTVVYGYFALLFVTPFLQKIFPSISGFNILSAGLVMGIMIVPYVSSLAEDAMRAVPQHLREGSYALGASKMQTAFRVVIPSALSGITSAYILGISRALGETMIVALAAGLQPNLTMNPLQPSETMTAFIVQVSLGDLPHGSIGYQSIYVVGLSLLIITFIFNILGFWFRKKYREAGG